MVQLTTDRHVGHDLRTGAIRALNRQRPANLFRTLLHANQSEMPVSSIAHVIVKSAPVISYDELHSPRVEHQIHEYPLRVRMFDCIVYRLLPDAEKIAFYRLGQRPERAIDFNLCLDLSLMR